MTPSGRKLHRCAGGRSAALAQSRGDSRPPPGFGSRAERAQRCRARLTLRADAWPHRQPTGHAYQHAGGDGAPSSAQGGGIAAQDAVSGCVTTLTVNARDAREYLERNAAPVIATGWQSTRAWLLGTALPALQTGYEYTRDVAVPAASTFVQETAVPYTRDVILPTLQDGYVYARDVALPAARAALRGEPAPASAAAPESGEAKDTHTVKPEHGVPVAAGTDEQLPQAKKSVGAYASISTVVSSATAPTGDQKEPLLTTPTSPHDIDAPPKEARFI